MLLILTEELWNRMREITYRTRLETGVTLFGTKDGERRLVKEIAGPGEQATHEFAHYSGDDTYVTQTFNALRRDDPSIEWLGELHAHPPGMTWLSCGDRQTVREVLLGTDDTYHPDEFIAGVIQRVSGSIVIYPVRFTKADLKGEEMEVVHGKNICKESEREGGFVEKAHRHCRAWQRWRRNRGHGCSDGRGQDHPHRS